MITLTIPQKLSGKEELVAIPRKEYENLKAVFDLIDKDQLWFWTKEWQKKEREADKDIKAGRVSEPLKTAKELRQYLKKLSKSK